MDSISASNAEQTLLLPFAKGSTLCGARQVPAHPHLSFPDEEGRRTEFQYGKPSSPNGTILKNNRLVTAKEAQEAQTRDYNASADQKTADATLKTYQAILTSTQTA